MLSVLVATAAGTGGGSETLQWALDQGGAFLVAIVAIVGWRLERQRASRAEERADAERTARNVLADSIMDKFLPALEKSTAATGEFVHVARAQQWQGPAQH